MADVMEKGRGIKNPSMLLKVRVKTEQVQEGAPGEMEHSEGMGETAGFGAVKGEEGGAELADSPCRGS